MNQQDKRLAAQRRKRYQLQIELTQVELWALCWREDELASLKGRRRGAAKRHIERGQQRALQKLYRAALIQRHLDAAGLLKSCGKPVDEPRPDPPRSGGPGLIHRFSTKISTGQDP